MYVHTCTYIHTYAHTYLTYIHEYYMYVGVYMYKQGQPIFIVAPCILIHVEFTRQQIHIFILKNTLQFTLKYT